MDVDLFIPCFIDQLYPETAENTKKLLEKSKPTPMPNGPKQVSTAVDKGPKEKGTDHLKKREE